MSLGPAQRAVQRGEPASSRPRLAGRHRLAAALRARQERLGRAPAGLHADGGAERLVQTVLYLLILWK